MDIFPQNSNLENLTRVKFGIDPTFSKLHLGHFVLVFRIDIQNEKIFFEDYDHHDKIYKNKT